MSKKVKNVKAASKDARRPKPKAKAATKHPPAKTTGARPTPPDAKAKSKAPAAAAARGTTVPPPHPPERPAGPSAKKATRKGSGGRREAKTYAPGELLLPGGGQNSDEISYFFRGCVAAEHATPQDGVHELATKRNLAEGDPVLEEAKRMLVGAVQRFASGVLEPMLPSRAQARRTFSGFLERVRGRRREIGAFLRGLDLGRTEVSHLDSHGETSLQNLMEWTARIEKMVEEGEEPEQADYNQMHRGIDQLDNTTEALIVDLELTLKRLRDRATS
jgi:hypothetical protein